MRNNQRVAIKPRSAKPMPEGEQWAMLKLHGTGSDFTVRDPFGTLPEKTVQGTTTNIWSDPANGLLWSGDNTITYTPEETAPLLDFRGFAGRLIIAADFAPVANTNLSKVEYLLCIGKYLAAGANSGPGSIHLSYNAPRVLHLNYRDAGADGVLSNQVFGNTEISGDGTNPVRMHVAFVIDMNPATPTVTYYRNGASMNSYELLLNGTDRPFPVTNAVGMTIGTRHNALTTLTDNTLGGGGSGARMDNLTFVRSATMTGNRASQIVQSLHRFKGERP